MKSPLAIVFWLKLKLIYVTSEKKLSPNSTGEKSYVKTKTKFITFKMKLKIKVTFCMLTFYRPLFINHLARESVVSVKNTTGKQRTKQHYETNGIMVRLKIEVVHNIPYTYFVVDEIDLFSYALA